MQEKPMSDDLPVVQFWTWFERHADEIRAAYDRGDNDWLDHRISPLIARIHRSLNWEIGPYNHPDYTFVLSPTIRENLSMTRRAVKFAPELPEWRFFPAKPPKELNSLVFETDNSRICADDWRYRLTAYNSGEFVDIELMINAESRFPSTQQAVFTELVVEALIGEECRLDRVGYLTPTIVANNALEEKSTPIRYLKDHLAQVLKPKTKVE